MWDNGSNRQDGSEVLSKSISQIHEGYGMSKGKAGRVTTEGVGHWDTVEVAFNSAPLSYGGFDVSVDRRGICALYNKGSRYIFRMRKSWDVLEQEIDRVNWAIEHGGDGMKTHLTVEMPNGEVWAVPVLQIAKNRAKHYAYEFDGDETRSLKEDTIPLFEENEEEIIDWAEGNMNWSDLYGKFLVKRVESFHYQDGWVNGKKGFLDLNTGVVQ